MDLGAAGLQRQPFPTNGQPLATVDYESRAAAMGILGETLQHPSGVSLLQGPPLSGKTTILQDFADSLPDDYAVAVVNGSGMDTADLLLDVLRQFGYELELDSTNELLGLLRIFAIQQADSGRPPLIAVENVHELKPSALHALCQLAAVRVQSGCAIKIVLAGDRPLRRMTGAEGMAVIAARVLHDFHLRPMTQPEAKHYLYVKLRAAGADFPAYVFPEELCAALWQSSGGWPGILDRIALLALSNADALPVSAEYVEHPVLPRPTWDLEQLNAAEQAIAIPPQAPHLVVTNNGSVMQELTIEKARHLIGRSEHNDISIRSRFVSRHHALLVRHGSATFLMDLNSTNGTFVNSKRVSNQVLKHEDVVTIGHHKIKFYDPFATTRGSLDGVDFADTAMMKTLEDMRRLLARENTELMTDVSEDIPTLQT